MIDTSSKWIGALTKAYQDICDETENEAANLNGAVSLNEAIKVELNSRQLARHLAEQVRECANVLDGMYPAIPATEDQYGNPEDKSVYAKKREKVAKLHQAELKKLMGEVTKFKEAVKRCKEKMRKDESKVHAVAEDSVPTAVREGLNEDLAYLKNKDGSQTFVVSKRDTKGMAGKQDKFSMSIIDTKTKKLIKAVDSHVSIAGAKKYGTSRGFKEEVGLDEGHPTMDFLKREAKKRAAANKGKNQKPLSDKEKREIQSRVRAVVSKQRRQNRDAKLHRAEKNA